MLSDFSYIKTSELTGDIKTDVKNLLILNNKRKTYEHVKFVAEMNVKIAELYGLETDLCEISGYLHDISSVVSRGDMLEYAMENGWFIEEAETKYPMLLHQRVSAVIAEQDFKITDACVLSAIDCHTSLKANPTAYDMALFVADKLAWDQEGEPPFYSAVKNGLKTSLESASLAYMDFIVEHKMIFLPPLKRFDEGARFLRRVLNK